MNREWLAMFKVMIHKTHVYIVRKHFNSYSYTVQSYRCQCSNEVTLLPGVLYILHVSAPHSIHFFVPSLPLLPLVYPEMLYKE